jgi:hypothetical protein
MRQCLDEGMLQSYFDGELSTETMEIATSHLAGCATCAAAARELEQESSLVSMALAPEFDARIPTESLRRRIDAAVAGLHVATVADARKSGVIASLFDSLSGLFNFTPQRTLGYASLMVVLAFAAIFGVLKFRHVEPPQTNTEEVAKFVPAPINSPSVSTPATAPEPKVGSTPTHLPVKSTIHRTTTPKAAPAVKLIPGERTYLQSIAKLDSAIKSGNHAMRPALQVEYERNLRVVDSAIAATRSAVKSNPNDPDAADFMFAAYQSKVDLLNTIADARVYNHPQH